MGEGGNNGKRLGEGDVIKIEKNKKDVEEKKPSTGCC